MNEHEFANEPSMHLAEVRNLARTGMEGVGIQEQP